MKKLLLTMLVLLGASTGFAALQLEISDPIITPTGSGTFLWEYNVSVSTGEQIGGGGPLEPTTQDPVEIPGFGESGDFGMVIDFYGYVPGTVAFTPGPMGGAAGDYIAHIHPVGHTPGGLVPLFGNDLAAPDLAFHYGAGAGMVTLIEGAPTPIGVFSAESIYNLTRRTSWMYQAQTDQAPCTGAGSWNCDGAAGLDADSEVGQTTTLGPYIPEPSTYVLMGAGLLALGLVRRYRKS
jgi:hypothetical protein